MEFIVPMLVSLGFGTIVTALISAMLARPRITTDDWVARLEAERQGYKAAARELEQVRRTTRGVVERMVSPELKAEQDKYQLLMDEWQPIEGTALRWSLDWLLEDVAARRGV